MSETYKDIKYANWNPAFNDLIREIGIIRRVGAELYHNPNRINVYHALIINLMSSEAESISDYDKLKKRMEKVEDNIYSKKYITDSKTNKASAYQRLVIRELRDIFTSINRDFTKGGLKPKVETKTTQDKGRALIS